MRAERVELSRARAHRILSPARLPFRPARMVDPAGLEPARFSLLTSGTPSCSGPRVPVGRIERPQAQCRAVYSRAPLTNRGHRGGIGRCDASIDAVPIPNLAYYLVVNVREFICHLRQRGQSFAQQGWQESNPRPPGWSRLSVPLDYTPSSVALCIRPRNTKEPPPFGSGSSTNWTHLS